MPDIKPCPFCGGSAEIDSVRVEGDSRSYLRCISCAAEGPWNKSKAAAVKRWNDRPEASFLERRILQLTNTLRSCETFLKHATFDTGCALRAATETLDNDRVSIEIVKADDGQ